MLDLTFVRCLPATWADVFCRGRLNERDASFQQAYTYICLALCCSTFG